MSNISKPPIFIVGAPRSGTTLLAAIISSHKNISAGQETQFFSKLSFDDLKNAVSDPSWPAFAVKLISSLTLSGDRVIELYGLSESDLHSYLITHTPSMQSMLESLTSAYAKRSSKPRWAEKTPNHLLHLSLIRELYPASPIIRIVRDPRDSSISIAKLPWASNSLVSNCYLWMDWFDKSREFFEKDKISLTIKYEDLVLSTSETVMNLCEFIGEEFDESMLSHHKDKKGVVSANEPWKDMVTKEVSNDRLQIWEKELPVDMRRASSLICYRAIDYFGYPKGIPPKGYIEIRPLNRRSIELNEKTIVNYLDNKILCVGEKTGKNNIPVLYVEPPIFGKSRTDRIKNIFIFLLITVVMKLKGREIRVINEIKPSDLLEKISIQLIKQIGKNV